MGTAQKAAEKAVKNSKKSDTRELSTGYTVRFRAVSRFIFERWGLNLLDSATYRRICCI